ncbi:hypothetical protein CRG98_006450, partial [Punica granatum]
MAEGDHVDVGRSQPFGPDSLSTTANARPAASHSCKRTPGVFRRPSNTSLALGVFGPASLTSAATDDQARIEALEGTVNQMATNMAELLALLRGPNRASSSSTPPSGPGPTVDPTLWAPPIQAPKNVEAPAPPTLYTSTVHPFTSQLPPPPAPSVVPLPPVTFLSSEHILSAPPPVSIPAPAMAYTVPPPMVFQASTGPASTHFQATELPPYPSLQPHAGLSYQAPPPERRLKRMEETIRALQAGDARPDARHGDGSLFPDTRLPPKFKIPEFKTYEGTTDPRHHLRHYRGKMLQYWEYEEFAEDIPTWEDLSRKFTGQYRYCAETPPTLLELSTKEMARGQKFEEYAAKWRAQAAKHIPPISEAQQIQLFHSTLRGVYYSHLLAQTSSFSDLIEVGKKLDLGMKLGRMEDPSNKGEESSKKVPATSSSSSGRRGKEVSVNTVNAAQQAPQQYSMNYTAAPPVAPSYAPHAPQYRPQTPTQQIYYSVLPPPPLPTVSSSVVHHYAPAPSQAPQYQPPAPRTSQPTQRALPPQEAAVGFTGIDAPHAPLVIDVPAREPYSNDRVPWTYEGGVGNLEQQFGVMGITRSGRLYENPATTDKGKAPTTEEGTRPRTLPTPSKKEAEAFMKVIKASEYKVVEQMAKSPTHISLLALLLNSEPHREALVRVLTAAQIPKGTPPNQIEETINSIFSNTISFSDDELPSEGCAHFRALHIVCKCNNHIVGRVMIDNGSALNVCPVTTLKQMNVDLNRIRPSKTAVRAFDGSRREALDPLGRRHSVLATSEGEIHHRGEDHHGQRGGGLRHLQGDAVPYISVGDDENLPFHSFETISVIRDYGEVGPSRADRMIGKVLLRHNYIPGTGLGARGQGINRPIEVEEYKHRRGLGFRPSCHEIIVARRGNRLYRLATYYGRLNSGIPVPPLSHFFPGPPLIIGSTSDGPSSDFDDTTDALPTVYAVTEEIPSGVHIRPTQEDEELNNWTSVLRYSAVIADVLHSNPNLRRVDSNPSEECLEEPGPIYFGEGLDEDSLVPEIEESLRRLEDRQLTSLEPTEEINVGTEEEPRILKIEVFAWSYADMPGLDPSIVKHFLPLDTEKFLPKRQQLRRQRASLLLRIKEEVVKQINAGFLEVCNYSEWVANIVPVEKKDGRVRVCVDYRDLNKASPKDNFPLPHIDILVDNTARHAQFSFMDGLSGYNQIRMAEEDKIKTTFTTMWGTFCYRIMPFGLKNAGATYQRAMVTLFHDMMHKEVEVYVDDMIAKSKEGEDHL